MILLIQGCSHTGKTLLAQRILERYHYPYFSLDHLKMGLIRSGMLPLSPCDDRELEQRMWPLVREMIKTAVENRQNLVVEGCYIPFDWKSSFAPRYLPDIRCCCLVMTEAYIQARFSDILGFANVIENRLDDSGCTREWLIRENQKNLALSKKYGWPCKLIDQAYPAELDLSELAGTMDGGSKDE